MQSTSSEWKLCDKVLSRGLAILVERNFSEQSIHMNVPQHLSWVRDAVADRRNRVVELTPPWKPPQPTPMCTRLSAEGELHVMRNEVLDHEAR